MFKINIENMINNACTSIKSNYGYDFVLKELVKHLRQLRDGHNKGNSKNICDAFFKLYVFNDDE